MKKYSFKHEAEAYLSLGRDPGAQAAARSWDMAALLIKNTEAENTLKEWRDPTQHSSQAEGRAEWRIGAEPPVREWQAWVWKAGAECLRFAPVSQSLSQTVNPTPTCRITEKRGQAQEFPAEFIFSWERRKSAHRALHQTLSATQLLGPLI